MYDYRGYTIQRVTTDRGDYQDPLEIEFYVYHMPDESLSGSARTLSDAHALIDALIQHGVTHESELQGVHFG